MDKLEKVIKGIEQCLICGIAEDKCIECPYRSYTSCITTIKRDALELLKEKQPKKGHWVMKYRHHKSVKHVKGYDAYDVEREIELVEESEGYEPYCSECGAAAAESFLCFCPRCGADMRESLNTGGEHE